MKNRFVGLLVATLVGLLFGGMQSVYAVNYGGEGYGAPGGSCSDTGDKSGCYDGCAFAYYQFSPGSSSATVAGVNVDNCGGFEGFWFNHFKSSIYYDLFSARSVGECLTSNHLKMYETVSNAPSGIRSSVGYSGAYPTGDYIWEVGDLYRTYNDYYVASGTGLPTQDFLQSSAVYFCYNPDPTPSTPSTPTPTPTPTPTNVTATFRPTVSISSDSRLTSLGYGTYQGDAGVSYKFTPTYTIDRTDSNNPPSMARTHYEIALGDTTSQSTVESEDTAETFAPAGSYDSSDSFNGDDQWMSVDWDETRDFCAKLSVMNSTYQDNTYIGRTGTPASTTNCVRLKGPQSTKAQYEGSIVISSTYGTVEGGDSAAATESFFTGTGTRKNYDFTVSYRIRRLSTDADRAGTVSTSYDTKRVDGTFSAGNYPSPTFSKTSSSLSAGSGWTTVATVPININIDLGAESTTCFYLSYDNLYTFRNSGTPYTTASDGRVHKCLKLTNPTKTFALSYGATSRGMLKSHDSFTITDSGHTGQLINQVVDSDTGAYVSYFPSSHDYGMTFVHTLSRTDDASLVPLDDGGSPIIPCANSSWRIQHKDNDGEWVFATEPGASGSSCLKASDSAKDILRESKVVMDSSNMGTTATHCERLSYQNTILFNVDGPIESTTATSSPDCVKVINPSASTMSKTTSTHTISIVPSVDGASVSGATGSAPSYSATDVDVNIQFNHSIKRVDSGFTEPAIACTPATIGNDSAHCFSTKNGSIYGNSSFEIGSNFSHTYTITGDGTNATIGPSTSTLYRFQAYRSSDGTISADSYSPTSTVKLSNGTGDTALLAGQTKTVCDTGVVADNATSEVYYEDIWRNVSYGDGGGTSEYAYTQKVAGSYAPYYVSPTSRTSEPYCVNVTREPNYRITDVTPSTSSADSSAGANEALNTEFSLTIDRDDTSKNYVTDPVINVTPITYIVEEYTGSDEADFIAKYGEATGGGNIDNTDYCSFFLSRLGSNVKDCSTDHTGTLSGVASGGNGVYGATGGSYSHGAIYKPENIIVPKIAVGSKFCVAIGVTPLSSSNTSGAFISRSICTNVSKSPAVHVWGGSVQTNASIKTALNNTTSGDASSTQNTYYGSWGEFALIARSGISGMASGAGLVGGKQSTQGGIKLLCEVSPLTIANSQCLNIDGISELGYSKVSASSTVLDELKTRYLAGAEGEDAPASDVNIFKLEQSGDKSVIDGAFLTSSSIGSDSGTVTNTNINIIYSNGNLDIRSNIEYTRTGSGVMKLSNYVPQIIIISEGDVNIYDNVTSIDAWIVAGGNIDTCSHAHINGDVAKVSDTATAGSVTLSSKICDKQLRINGPVIGKSIQFKRTYGAEYSADGGNGSIAEPAEIVNYPASAIIFGASEASRNGEPQVTYIKTLAPRY